MSFSAWVSSGENESESEQLTGNYEKEADSVQRYLKRTQNLKSEDASCVTIQYSLSLSGPSRQNSEEVVKTITKSVQYRC